MLRRTTLSVLVTTAVLWGTVGCSSDSLSVNARDNDGSTLTTQPGGAIQEDWLLGKWDIDGELTNTANARAGVTAIASDVVKDVLGDGWKFESAGVLKVDAVVGYKTGGWSLQSPDLLQIDLPGSDQTLTYKVSFREGYLYLQDSHGLFKVFEKNKFFAF